MLQTLSRSDIDQRVSRLQVATCTAAIALAAALLGCSGDEPAAVAPAPDAGSPSGIQQGTTISLAAGKIQGSAESGARRFLGIPYAEPPLGTLRWKAPVKSGGWSTLRQATEFGGRCAQTSSLQTGSGTDNEDCLYLNVWTPEPAPEKPLPVMFWIHGGGNQNGSTSDSVPTLSPPRLFYDGQSFAANHGVVLVSVNYRLGVFGYLAHPALTAEGSPSGNQGLLDQRLALEWVRDNIAAFGGDPDNVTIFGESAGARNVCFHVVSPGSKGLFHRAISQSGDCTGKIPLRADAEVQAADYAAAVGCGDTVDVLGCLRDKPASALMIPEQLIGAAPDPVPGGAGYSGGSPRWEFRPVVDGTLIPKMPRDLFAEGAIARVPYLMGTNTEEGALSHLTAPPAATEAEYLLALERRFGDFSSRVAAAYPVTEFASPNAALIRVSTDSRYACAVQDFAERAARAGLGVYAYNFDLAYAIPNLGAALGPAHGAELTFVFNSLAPEQWPAGHQAISDLMQGYWSRLARSGDPNGNGAPVWDAFLPERGNRLNLDLDPNPVEAFRAERCALWIDYYDSILYPP
jgi:para-nitrobenzyl esterase